MIYTIKILKILIAIGFLGVAYLLFVDETLFGIRPVVLLLLISVVGAFVLFMDYKAKPKQKPDNE